MLPPFSWCFANKVCDKYDGYAVVSEYFGRGLFNKLTVVTEEPVKSPATSPAAAPAPAITAPAVQLYGPGAEAKLRLQEGQSKQVYVANTSQHVPGGGSAVIPVPEGRMRLMEQTPYSSSLEANINRLQPKVHKQSPSSRQQPSPTNISSAITNNAPNHNPFDENYDDAKNPFADEETNEPTNPFEDDDYDTNLNPFS